MKWPGEVAPSKYIVETGGESTVPASSHLSVSEMLGNANYIQRGMEQRKEADIHQSLSALLTVTVAVRCLPRVSQNNRRPGTTPPPPPPSRSLHRDSSQEQKNPGRAHPRRPSLVPLVWLSSPCRLRRSRYHPPATADSAAG